MAGRIDSQCGELVHLPRASHADQRGAERVAVMIRTAKLVSAAGEFLCIVRDVSATGVRLKLFHDLPGDVRLALQLANGASYSLDMVWQECGQAGFRFCQTIDVEAFVHGHSGETHHPIRLCLHVPVFLAAGGMEDVVTLTGLSQQGADFESARHLAVGEPVKLWCDGHSGLIGTICSRSGGGYGVVLRNHFGIGELAELVADLQLGRSRIMPV